MSETHFFMSWAYLIFEIPLAMAAFMMLMTVAHPHGGNSHGHAVPHGASHDSDAPSAHSHVPQGHIDHAAHPALARHTSHASAKAGRDVSGFVLGLLGARKAPLPLVVEAGLMGWGVFGFCANMFLQVPHHSLASPHGIAIAVALIGAFTTMHVSGALFSRFMPEDESSAISHNALFGITGETVYQVTESGGRIHVYDTFGTLHDETCRVAPGQPAIERGHRIMIIDVDPSGNLIVEEIV